MWSTIEGLVNQPNPVEWLMSTVTTSYILKFTLLGLQVLTADSVLVSSRFCYIKAKMFPSRS